MRRTSLGMCVIVISCMMLFSACNTNGVPKSSNYKDEYLGEEDFNPSTVSWLKKPHGVTVLDGTLYFVAGDFLFFADAESKQARVLCFKPDCLHNEDPDPAKIPQCDAYLGSLMQTFLGHYDGKLYFSCLNQKTGHTDIMESMKDGSRRKSVLENIDNMEHICFHRGVFYYVLREVELSGESVTSLMAYSLLSPRKAPYKIVEFTDGSIIDQLLPYGTRVIFSRTTPYVEDVGDDIFLYEYNIRSGAVSELPFEVDTQIYGLYDGKLIVRVPYPAACFCEYTFSDKSVNPSDWLNEFYDKQKPAMPIYDQIQNDIAFFNLIKEDFSPDYDLHVINREGNVVATIEKSAFGTTTSETVTWNGKTYYMAYRTMDPFSVCLYSNEDLLQGVVNPEVLLQVESFYELIPAVILPRFDDQLE